MLFQIHLTFDNSINASFDLLIVFFQSYPKVSFMGNTQKCWYALLKRAVPRLQDLPQLQDHAKVRVPKPQPFDGVWNIKDLENFLWGIGQFFSAAHIHVNEQVTIIFMYLSGYI